MTEVFVFLLRVQTDSLKLHPVNVNVNMCLSFCAFNKHHRNNKGSLINLDGLIFSILGQVISEQRTSIEQG